MHKRLQDLFHSFSQVLAKPEDNAPQEHVDLQRLETPVVNSQFMPVSTLFGSQSKYDNLLERYESHRPARAGAGEDWLH
jgi:hypothetical protein